MYTGKAPITHILSTTQAIHTHTKCSHLNASNPPHSHKTDVSAVYTAKQSHTKLGDLTD